MKIKLIFSITLLIGLFTTTGGCTTFRYIPLEGASDTESTETKLPVAVTLSEPRMSGMMKRFDPDAGKETPRLTTDAVTEGLEAELKTLTTPTANETNTVVSVSVTLDKERSKPKGSDLVQALLSIGTVFTIPFYGDIWYDFTTTVSHDGREIYRITRSERVRKAISGIVPTSLLIGDPGIGAYKEMGHSAGRHSASQLRVWAAQNQREFERLAGKGIKTKTQWLSAHPDTLYRSVILEELAHKAPSEIDARLAWHKRNMERFSDYARHVPGDDALLLIGPQNRRILDLILALREGQKPEILAARIRAGNGSYKSFNNHETTILERWGIPAGIIVAMIEASTEEHQSPSGPSIEDIRRKNPSLASLVINNNSGQYMNPWTSDGVLAEWVDKAINADIGGAVGSAAGAAAGAMVAQKALENVPFGSLFASAAGSKMGEAAGREMAIKASGGEAYIRQTSDQSFRSLDDMARYISTTYAGTAHYQDAIKAADAVYPGLTKAIAQAQSSAAR